MKQNYRREERKREGGGGGGGGMWPAKLKIFSIRSLIEVC